MNTMQANICLITVTLIWSCEIIVQAVIPPEVSPFATTCISSSIGALLLGAYFFKRIALTFSKHRSTYIRRIVFLGVLDATYNVLYLCGYTFFDVSTGIFTASMSAVILPVMLLVMHRSMKARTWVSAGLVFAGILVAFAPSAQPQGAPGVALMAVGALIRALFIVKLNDYAHEDDPITLATGISGVCACISFIPWIATDHTVFFGLPWNSELIAAYFIYGYFIVAFATVLNIYAQRRATAPHATIIYSTEIIFSNIWAVLLPDNIISPVAVTPWLVGGCALVALGNLVELFHRKQNRPETPRPYTENVMLIQISHPFAKVLDSLRSQAARSLLLFAMLLVVYLVIAMPFRVLTVIPGFTDIRPVYMLYPVYGIFFGLPGCWAAAFGNLICDILSGSLRWSSIAGFAANFLYPFMLYLMWTRLPKKPFSTRRRRSIGMLVVSFILCALTQVAIIAPIVMLLYPQVDIGVFALSVMCNATLFPTVLAIPFIILIHEELGYEPLAYRQLDEPLYSP